MSHATHLRENGSSQSRLVEPEVVVPIEPLRLTKTDVEQWGKESFYTTSYIFLKRLIMMLVQESGRSGSEVMKNLRVLDIGGGGGQLQLRNDKNEIILARYPPYFAMLCGLNGAEAYSLDVPPQQPSSPEGSILRSSLEAVPFQEWPYLAGMIYGNVLHLLDNRQMEVAVAGHEQRLTGSFDIITCRNLIGANDDPLLRMLVDTHADWRTKPIVEIEKVLRERLTAAVPQYLRVGGFFIVDWGDEAQPYPYTCWQLQVDGTLREHSF